MHALDFSRSYKWQIFKNAILAISFQMTCLIHVVISETSFKVSKDNDQPSSGERRTQKTLLNINITILNVRKCQQNNNCPFER